MKFSSFVLLLLAIAATIVAVANRAPVAFRLDPFSAVHSALTIEMPLYLLLFLTFLLGVAVGGITIVWTRATRSRARRAEAAPQKDLVLPDAGDGT